MKIVMALLAAIAVLAGCHHAQRSNPRAALSTDAVAHADVVQAQKIVNACLPANTFTLAQASVRQKVLTCLVPQDPAKKAAFESCVSNAARVDHLTTKAGRKIFIEGAAGHPSLVSCVVASRAGVKK